MIGTNAAGTAALANGAYGIKVGNAVTTTIGGTGESAGNLISGNDADGILVYHGANETLIKGNMIGTNAVGTAAIANGESGIQVGVSNNTTIGGTTSSARNLISGNTDDGIYIYDDASGTVIQGNYIGTNGSGTSAIANDPIIQGSSPTGTSGKQYRQPADWGNLRPHNPIWLKNWIAFSEGKFGDNHIGEGAHEIWFSSDGGNDALNNAFYILSLEQSGPYGLNCPGSCVTMPSTHPIPIWLDQRYDNP